MQSLPSVARGKMGRSFYELARVMLQSLLGRAGFLDGCGQSSCQGSFNITLFGSSQLVNIPDASVIQGSAASKQYVMRSLWQGMHCCLLTKLKRQHRMTAACWAADQHELVV